MYRVCSPVRMPPSVDREGPGVSADGVPAGSGAEGLATDAG